MVSLIRSVIAILILFCCCLQISVLSPNFLNGFQAIEQTSNDGSRISMPMQKLVGRTDDYACPKGLVLVKDTIDPSFFDSNQERKIPKVVHVTSKSRCMTQAFANNIDRWRFPGHSLFVHDDDALNRLLRQHWTEFPHLQLSMKCIHAGASIADMWRYVILWEYGGIYTDIDNAPGHAFYNNETGSVITSETDSLFEQENGGFPSQYFFAASLRHPLMYLAVQHTMVRLLSVESIQNQYVPLVTGPGAIKSAMITFIGNGYPTKGTYEGIFSKNHTVTVVGSRKESRLGKYLIRNVQDVQKQEGYGQMNMTHFSKKKNYARLNNASCLNFLLRFKI